jgi:hypothetical protein
LTGYEPRTLHKMLFIALILNILIG